MQLSSAFVMLAILHILTEHSKLLYFRSGRIDSETALFLIMCHISFRWHLSANYTIMECNAVQLHAATLHLSGKFTLLLQRYSTTMNVCDITSMEIVFLQLSETSFRIDHSVSQKMQEIAMSGVRAIHEIRRQLSQYVTTELFAGRRTPAQTDTRYFPTSRQIVSCLYRVKQRMR